MAGVARLARTTPDDATALGGLPREGWRDACVANPALALLGRSRRVLMLQGPVGPFFDRVARWLQAGGAEVRRVVFQGGDEHDCRAVVPTRFDQPPQAWHGFCRQLLEGWRPDCIVLFGQARHYHKVALDQARALDVAVVVMEEGYFRPGFVTMELGGVNGYSTTLDRFQYVGDEDAPALQPDSCEHHFQKMAWHASQHYLSLHRGRARYPHYQHHRSTDVAAYAGYWLRSWWRKGLHLRGDKQFQAELFASGRPYYFVPLQLDGDSQIRHHSPYRNSAEFVLQVMASFARHAPDDHWIVFRQHPHARGGRGNKRLIDEIACSLSIEDRVRHMVEGDTPDLAQHSRGVVVINSTVGLQALERGARVIALGTALYRHEHLTFSGELDDFWNDASGPDETLVQAFLHELKALTQARASIYDVHASELQWTSPAAATPGINQSLD